MANVILAPVHTRLLKAWTALQWSGVAASHTGNTTETVLATIPLAAAAMGPNGALKITSVWSYTQTVNSKTMRARLGGLAGTAFQALVVTTAIRNTRMQCQIHNRNANNAQASHSPTLPGGWSTDASAIVTGTIDTSIAQNLVITAQLGLGSETLTLESYLVELLYGA